jgi:ankyrin repeat protein
MPRDFDIPNNYLCPINFQIMSDPVVAEDGHTYEREAIEKWLKTNDTSPLSNDKLNHKNLTANHHARSEILNFLDKHPSLYEEDQVYLPQSWVSNDTSPLSNDKLNHKNLTANHHARSEILNFLDKHPSLYEEDQVYLPQSWVSEFIIAIRQNDVKNATRLLAKHRPLLTAKLEGDDTALHLACKFSSPELVDLILKNLKQRNQLMVTLGINLELIHLNVLLERALNSKDYDKCELLLKLGAGSDAPFICEPGKLSTLHVAARCGDIEILNRLLGAGTPASNDVQDANGDTPLHIAVQVGDAKVILLLLNAGADPAIKNNKNQTPLELAIQEEIKILIVRTVKELNKNKEDKNNLQNVITGQASEIATLKATLSSLSTQKRSLEQKSSIEANELNMFLKLVAEGEQGTAKAMLMNKPRLALLRGNITDLSKRTFIDITGFQYAVWALDWHMWTMIRESLSSDEAKKQAEEFETGPWVKRHGIHAQWILDKLIQAYKVAIDLYEQENFDDGNTAWIEQIGE